MLPWVGWRGEWRVPLSGPASPSASGGRRGCSRPTGSPCSYTLQNPLLLHNNSKRLLDEGPVLRSRIRCFWLALRLLKHKKTVISQFNWVYYLTCFNEPNLELLKNSIKYTFYFLDLQAIAGAGAEAGARAGAAKNRKSRSRFATLNFFAVFPNSSLYFWIILAKILSFF